ncbi:serine O-acetyltransferase [Candidatus Koribacter versatilis Ellin345]|uniref:Serine acetyltransferase n=1 Tax=Koribacter versatilis (strain Ellin345) TaxID=204669 RepID=Q1IPV2_KORVE|nr:serine O-acetyltransferase [Candidatus Koribacter versatilis]ABF41098.1 serine O-acetyltransferase [Candidatus Koribacter versatilis Ellin345]
MGFWQGVREDIQAIFEHDPAATSMLAVLLCYPGLHARTFHRFNHWLWIKRFRLLARWLSQVVRFFTGIEIHPGAVLGRRVFIDHGMGVVIGETAFVGDDVTLYQGVTLGGTGKEKGKRHPTLRSGVFVGNNANILGNITIGENSRVGAGSVVLRDVPPNSTVVGVPAHIIYQDGKRVLITDPKDVKDPLSDVIIALAGEVRELKERLGFSEPASASGDHAVQHLQSVRTLADEDSERDEYRFTQRPFDEQFTEIASGI